MISPGDGRLNTWKKPIGAKYRMVKNLPEREELTMGDLTKERYEKLAVKAKNDVATLRGRRNDIIEETRNHAGAFFPADWGFYKNDVNEYGWNNGVADYPTPFSGVDMACYVDSSQKAVKAAQQRWRELNA